MERITATNPFTGRSSELVLTKREEFCVDRNWSIEPKFSLTAHPEFRPSHQLRFVEKACCNPDATLKKWRQLKHSGLPVVPTMRELNNDNILMTDLTFDGSKLFGKYRYHCSKGSPTDLVSQIFSSIDPKAITGHVMKLTEDASEKKIVLASDDPFEVLVHPDGTWQLIILDLTNVSINPSGSKDKLLEKNTMVVSWFLEILDGIREEIKGRAVKSDPDFDLDLI